ncbi:MAG: alpha/beta hydrolase [Acidobacteriota bacterium]
MKLLSRSLDSCEGAVSNALQRRFCGAERFSKRLRHTGKRYRYLSVCAVLFGAVIAANAQQQVIPLWPGAAPGSEKWTYHEQTVDSPTFHTRVVLNVSRPTLTVYLPEPSKANGTAVIVCPGGGFHFLSLDNEGTEVAHWLTTHGVTVFLLKYRLVHTDPADFAKETMQDLANTGKMQAIMGTLGPMVLADGQRAVRIVRRHAADWKIDPKRIGIIGFSAGGYVSADVALHHDAASRPDFAAAIYPALPPHAMVPPDAPPMFIACASDDPLVPPLTNAVRLYTLWEIAGIPAELHVYGRGGHGFGMTKHGLPVDHWIDAYGDWLRSQGLLKPAH